MSLIDHIEEMRWTLIRCACAVIVCAIPCGIFRKRVFEVITRWPFSLIETEAVPRIIYTAPADAVMFSIRIALTCGTLVASPFIFQQIWSFVSPGLYKKEKAVIIPAVVFSTFCFFAGVAFCYYLLPLLLKFLTEFAGGQIEAFFRINEYFGFLITTCLAFGLAFELPVAAFVLSKAGIIDHRLLMRYFRHAIVVIFIIAAILTPPDVLSQILLALPLLLLYGVSVLVSRLAGGKARNGDLVQAAVGNAAVGNAVKETGDYNGK